MSKLLTVILSTLFVASMAFAQAPAASDCEAKAVGKNGKPLAGAAKTAFLKKCESDTKGTAAPQSDCESKAVSKDGKPLTGAAKAASIKSCEKKAKEAK